MPYSTLAGIEKVLSSKEIARLTDDTSGQVVDVQIVEDAISSADELIDGYLRSRYALPLMTTPKLITNISVDLAIYFLHQRRFRTNMPESIESQYKNQLKLLEQIQKGFLHLGIEQKSTLTNQSGGVRVNKTDSDRYFSKNLMDRF